MKMIVVNMVTKLNAKIQSQILKKNIYIINIA